MFRGVRLDSLNYVNAAHLLSYYRNTSAYTVKTTSSEAFLLKEYIEERAVEIGNYIIETKATVRQTAKKFGVSKSTVHKRRNKQACEPESSACQAGTGGVGCE